MPDRSDPFGELEQFFDEFMEFGGPIQRQIPVDVIDSDDAVVVHAEIPGRDPASIDVTLAENRTLRLEASGVETDEDGRYVSSERDTGAVERQLQLPAAVDEDKTEASYDAGVLRIRLPKLTGSSDATNIPVN